MDREKRENVINGLERIRDWSQFAVNKGWLIAGANEKMVKYAKDALELLKAQEPVKTKHNNGVTHWYASAECDSSVNPGDKYCPECGRRLKWE